MDGRPRHDHRRAWVARGALAALLGLGLWMHLEALRTIDARLAGVRSALRAGEERQEVLRDEIVDLHRGLGDVAAGLAALEEGLGAVRREATIARVLAERLERTEGELGMIGEAVEAQAGSLQVLAEAQASFGPDVLASELAARDARLAQQVESLEEIVGRAEAKAEESSRLVEELDETVRSPRDLSQMWRDLVGPVVQLAGETSVGSGVLLSSRFDEARGAWATPVLTAWHVVRDIQGPAGRRDAPVPVTIYAEDGGLRAAEARLLCNDADIDIALLELLTPGEIENGARIPRREELAAVRIFDEIYAVGCPLGNAPIPTRGEIATSHQAVDTARYWMINAPTYIGNSGGGIFHSETHELLGIFSRIYTHGTVRPTIVPHMGLVTPLDVVYDWLAREGYAVVEPADGTEPVHLAAAGG
ncbi:MAG: trypsin-like peptidase domain-containing protein [Planctomycetota bacterium]